MNMPEGTRRCGRTTALLELASKHTAGGRRVVIIAADSRQAEALNSVARSRLVTAVPMSASRQGMPSGDIVLVDHYAYESEISRLRAALEASERVAMMVDGLISELRAAEEKIVACEKCIGQLREGVRYYGGKDLLDKIDNDPEEVLE